MKKIYFFLTLCSFLVSQAQFKHLEPGQESEHISLLTYEDGTTVTGYVKNNSADEKLLRLISNDQNSFKHANVKAPSIKFKETSGRTFESIAAGAIKTVMFTDGKDSLVYEKLNVYPYDARENRVDKSKVEYIFQPVYKRGAFITYRNTFINRGMGGPPGGSTYWARRADSDETIYFNVHKTLSHKGRVNYFKTLGKGSKAFESYMDDVQNKRSAAYKAYKKAEDEYLEEVKNFLKDNKEKISTDDSIIMGLTRYIDFMYYYFGKKYDELKND